MATARADTVTSLLQENLLQMTAPDQDFTATEPKTAEAEEATPWLLLLLLLVAALRLSRELASAAPAAAVVTASAICRDRAGLRRPQGRAKKERVCAVAMDMKG
jgi:hypothetical protein